jgi:uncharacterized membrane protein
MTTTRLEAFSDGVIAIILTIMVLELKVPHETSLEALRASLPHFWTYLLSFVFLGIYWTNHHHLLQASECVNGKILWANLHLLFWLSLVPFVTGWMGENEFSSWPVALYGIVLLFAGLAYFILTRALISQHGKDSALAKAIGVDIKGIVSQALYASAVLLAFYYPRVSLAIYVGVAVMWLVPDKRIERVMELGKCD